MGGRRWSRYIRLVMHSKNTTVSCVLLLAVLFTVPEDTLRRLLPKRGRDVSVYGVYSGWSAWSECVCRVKTRTRFCTNRKDSVKHCADIAPSVDATQCNVSHNCPQDGKWSNWGSWTPCTPNCRDGYRSITKECNNPPPAFGGRDCNGRRPKKFVKCDLLPPCPVNGGLGVWGRWSACSTTCGGGSRTRKRNCDKPVPKFNGKPCSGVLVESGACKLRDCVRPTAKKTTKKATILKATKAPTLVKKVKRAVARKQSTNNKGVT